MPACRRFDVSLVTRGARACVRCALCALTLYASSVAAADQVSDLPEQVRQALERFKLDGSGLSLYVQRIGERRPLLQFRANTARNPASAIKLIVALAALEKFTPAHMMRTELYTDGELDKQYLKGNLIVRGGGDPTLSIERMWLLVQQLRRKNIVTIAGDLIIDQSLFESINEDPSAFDKRPLRLYNLVPAPLVANYNVTQLQFMPSRKGKSRVQVQIYPPIPGLKIHNRLKLGKGRCRGYQRGISLTMDELGALHLDGRFPKRCGHYTLSRSLLEKEHYFSNLFRQLWTASGGTWRGQWRRGLLGEDKLRLLVFNSLPLGDILHLMNKYSNNLIARTVFLLLSTEGDPQRLGSSAASFQAIDDWLRTHDVKMPELVIDNGSGRSRDVRISARSLGKLLALGWQSPYMPEFIGSMSLGGLDGTLKKYDYHPNSLGRIHAKSGMIDHVSALAGYYFAPDGDRYIFVVLHNQTDVHRGAGPAVQHALIDWLVRGTQ